MMAKFKSKKEAQQHHIQNYRSDGVGKGRYQPGTSEYFLGRFITNSIPNNSMHLDVGANTGVIGLMLKQLNHCYVKGVELVPELAKKCCLNGIYCKQGEAEKLPYPDNKFDSLTIIEVLEHLYSPKRAIREALRVLKPGGLLVASFPLEEELGHYHNKTYTTKKISCLFDGFDVDYKLVGIADAHIATDKPKPKWCGVIAQKKEIK